MSTLNLPLPRVAADKRRAGSLTRTLYSKLLVVWRALEHQGQRRAARELALTADRIEASRPELAAQLRTLVREAQTY